MATRLGPPYPPSIKRTPPHMSPEDEEIYRAWWPQHAAKAKTVFYDVGLGSGSTEALPPNAPANYAGAWIHNTQKRADMLTVMPSGLWLIEFRHAATSNAIGRLLSYQMLWQENPVLPGKLQLFLVSNHFDPDLNKLAKFNRIEYFWV